MTWPLNPAQTVALDGLDSEHKRYLARIAAERLARAARWLRARAPTGPLHELRDASGQVVVWYRLDYPGIVRAFDAITGALLAESKPGQPDVLADGFEPPDRPCW
jgi:hypothetical protein